jgi:hypothetical protein
MAGDCPNFAESAEQNGAVPLSEAILLDALNLIKTEPVLRVKQIERTIA